MTYKDACKKLQDMPFMMKPPFMYATDNDGTCLWRMWRSYKGGPIRCEWTNHSTLFGSNEWYACNHTPVYILKTMSWSEQIPKSWRDPWKTKFAQDQMRWYGKSWKPEVCDAYIQEYGDPFKSTETALASDSSAVKTKPTQKPVSRPKRDEKGRFIKRKEK